MIYHDIPWYTMIYHDIPWYTIKGWLIFHDIPWLSHDILGVPKKTPNLSAPWGFCPCCRSGAWLSRDQFTLDVSIGWPNWNLWWNSAHWGIVCFSASMKVEREMVLKHEGHVQAATTIPSDLSLPYRSLGTNGTRNGGRHSSVSFMPINWTTVTHSWIFMECRVRWHKLFLFFHCCTAWALPFQHGCPT